jgi:hypothetical protein
VLVFRALAINIFKNRVCPHVTDRKSLWNFTKTCGQIPLLFTPGSNVGHFACGSNYVISHVSRAALYMTDMRTQQY